MHEKTEIQKGSVLGCISQQVGGRGPEGNQGCDPSLALSPLCTRQYSVTFLMLYSHILEYQGMSRPVAW